MSPQIASPLPDERLQGHWLLASLGKTVLRPGGLELTTAMLKEAAPSSADRIVEFGPGVGKTATLLLQASPASYTGVDPNPEGRGALSAVLAGHPQARVVEADAQDTGLEDGSADLVVGEAMLSMCSPQVKQAIVREAARILAPGGRYAIHELGLTGTAATPDEAGRTETSRELSRSIKVPARPLPLDQWRALLEDAGLTVTWTGTAPMHLLKFSRFVADEGVWGTLRFMSHMLRRPQARKRVLAMRKTFADLEDQLTAVSLVAVKRAD
ncbi:MAG: class I SAM-dependent methyltransferase [Actinomycetaceae bacterium]|nr:class I SAM-dependent methyltransferase [Actinomycetaceae bacterium]MDU0970286.1 class I SAM-dependent methyltransferase [Actinomycetaceae bacterium]